MGAGKSEAAIRHINTVPGRYIYITPFLSEVERVITRCEDKHFKQPERNREGRFKKFQDFQSLIASGENIASTHAMFSKLDDETLDIVRSHGYTLIMDEVHDVLSKAVIHPDDMQLLFDAGYARMDGTRVVWGRDDYSGAAFRELMEVARFQELVLGEGGRDSAYYWLFPRRVFGAFDTTYILTYLFRAYPLRAYFDANEMPYVYIGTHKAGDHYEFCDEVGVMPPYVASLGEHIHILENDRLNDIGRGKTALSYNWFKSARSADICQVKNNIYNYYHNICEAPASKRLWTCPKEHAKDIRGDGYARSFIVANERATNRWSDRTDLAYCINVFMDPRLARVISDMGQDIDADTYAVSEMVQWIWRSAIRNGGDINIYVPSTRMRRLLQQWIREVTAQASSQV